jgi:ZIP family zinc transporter
MGLSRDKAEGIKTTWQRSVLLILAITLHNIPEGLSVGVAFGALAHNPETGMLTGAIALRLVLDCRIFPKEQLFRFR